MAATEFEIRFAQSRIDYFDKVLKKGENDKVKTLLKAIKAEGGSSFGASDIANAIKNAKETTQEDKDKAVKAADTALKAATTAASDLTTATNAKKAADDMKVGDGAVLTAAKTLLGDKTVTDIRADDGTDNDKLTALYVNKAPEFLKDYGFINAIAKNIPNAGKNVLETGADTFSAYKSNTLKDDALKAGNAYFKIIATVCGTGPFVTADLPEKDAHSHHVQNCLDEANKVAFTILSINSCGKDKLKDSKVDDACYKGLADKGADLYSKTDFDKMHTDLSGEYPYDKVFSELDAIA
jgi:hypothetical protein